MLYKLEIIPRNSGMDTLECGFKVDNIIVSDDVKFVEIFLMVKEKLESGEASSKAACSLL